MPGDGGAVLCCASDGDFEFARQKGKFGVQGTPLAQDFSKRSRVGHFVRSHTGALVRGDVADAVAAGLDAVHVHAGQQIHHIGAFGERYPVELHVLAGAEMAETNREMGRTPGRLSTDGTLKHLFVRVIVFARNAGQHAHLCGGEFAIRHCHTQHGCVALDVPTVLQTQRAKVIVTQRACHVAFELVAMLCRTCTNEMAVKVGVLVHKWCFTRQ